MRPTVVINVVGLSARHLGPHTPRIQAFANKGRRAFVRPSFPAVTCTAQSDFLTGVSPSVHGIVGNGWYHRELAETQFWKQPDMLVQAPKVWDRLRRRDAGFTCAKTFWWYNMYSEVEYSVTPRPMYPADGRKVFDIYSWPYSLGHKLKGELGAFPFPTFWGPAAGEQSPAGPPDAVSRWIAEAAKWIDSEHNPTLQLVYLPHLDYNLQRFGVSDGRIETDLRAIDQIVGDLIDFFEARERRVLLVSEYGITDVHRPVHLNRLFRERGWLVVKEELGRELIDFGASDAFAVADHQVAHVYVRRPTLRERVAETLRDQAGVGRVIVEEQDKFAAGIAHPRAGDIVVESTADSWFTYYYWMDDRRAPDFARCVDIHRKPGYDPVELFVDPELRLPKAHIAWRLLRKKLGFRMLMDVIPLDASLVRGSHGRIPESETDWPMLIGDSSCAIDSDRLSAQDVRDVIENTVCP